MNAWGFWQLSEVSDKWLLESLRELLAAEGRSEARIVAHLAEVDARRIHLKAAAPSLFSYCQKQLGLSDNQAYYRIAAARVAQKFPVVFELLERRAIHLTNIAPLAKHLTTENHIELLGEAGRLSKRELLRWLARRYPQPEVSSHIRKRPDRELVSRELPRRELPPKAGAVSAGPTGSLEPRSETHYRLQLNTPERVKAKLELARDLMSHANPSGDLVVVVERGLDLLIAQLQKARFGQTRPQKNARSQQPARPDESGSPNHCVPTQQADRSEQAKPTGRQHSSAAEQHAPSRRGDSRRERADFDRSKSSPRSGARSHLPRETLRRLVERDEPCCSFVSEDGTRCEARAFIEIDHRQPWAKGGPDTLENLRWLCRAHNRLMAERDFGEPRVQRAIAQRRSSPCVGAARTMDE
jgi:hypothetical protein